MMWLSKFLTPVYTSKTMHNYQLIDWTGVHFTIPAKK